MIVPPTRYSRDEIVRRLAWVRPATPFRGRYAYDNLLDIAAGVLVEALSGLSWEALVQQLILDPCGMSRTFVTAGAVGGDDVASAHGRLADPGRRSGPHSAIDRAGFAANTAPAGGVSSCADDMGLWLQVQLRRGDLPEGGRVFSEAAAHAMWAAQTTVPSALIAPAPALSAPTHESCASGWYARDYRGHALLLHTGAGLGSKALAVLLPDHDAAFSVLLNSEDGGVRWAIAYRLLDEILGLASPDWIGLQLEAERSPLGGEPRQGAPEIFAGGDATPALEVCVGRYVDAWYGAVTVRLEQGALRLRLEPPFDADGPLEPLGNDRFRTRFINPAIGDASVRFVLDEAGRAIRLEMKALSPTADVSFDFHDLVLERAPD